MFGLLDLSWVGYLVATLVLTQVTIASVTIYLHRCQAHRALSLHPVVSHFFRFWLWLTTGMVTSEWVAIHRKHHAMTDVEGDPHSPVVLGIKKVLWEGAELYRTAKNDKAMVEQYSHGTPNDWIEKNLYQRHSGRGLILMLLLDLLLFGLPGVSIWAVQMIWIPFWAAGVINGLAHYWGYRNFECEDSATNLIPFAFWIGGEELHNNHHTYASSAKFSVKWWEFDIGWLYIRTLSFFKLAKVKKLPPKLVIDRDKQVVDLQTVRAVVGNRFQVLATYYTKVIQPILKQESLRQVCSQVDKRLLSTAAQLLKRREALPSATTNLKLAQILKRFEELRLVYAYRQSLQNIWLKTAKSQKELIQALQQWCKQAEESGIEVLRQFAIQLRCYSPV